MNTEPGLVTRLCEEWEDALAGGRTLTPEELCKDHPDALDEVRRAVAALKVTARALAGPSDTAFPALPPACRFRLTKFLAQGGLGRVYTADDLELGRPVAVKFVRPDRATGPARRRFRTEAEVTGRLEHPGVAPVYGLVELPDGGFCYAMRLLQGQTLADAVDRLPPGPPTPAALRPLLRHVQSACDTVAFAHSRGIVHRDLKPQNVMLGGYGETWVVDWGLAKDVRRADDIPDADSAADYDGTRAGAVVGTPGFMAPEQTRGEAVGPAADIYALGVTLGAVLVRRPPRPDEPVADWLKSAADVPAPLLAVAAKATAADPAARYPDSRHLAADVERWLADEPVSVFRDPFPVRASRWAKRHRTGVTAAAVVLLAALPLAVALALVSEGARKQAVDDQKRVSDEKDKAEQNLAVADQLAGDVIERVVENPRLKEADLRQARADILTQVGGVYARVAGQRAGDPRAAFAVARADRLLGVVYRDGGRHTEGVAALRRAETALAALAPDPAVAVDLARTRSSLGWALSELGRPTEAADVLTAGRRTLAGVTHADAPRVLGLLLNNHGLVLHGLGKHAAADEAYRASAAALEPRLSQPPPADGTPPHADLAITCSNHGLLAWERGNRDEANTLFNRAIELNGTAAKARPDLRSLKRQEAFARANFGGLLTERGDKDGAIAQFTEAVKLTEALVAEVPSAPDYQAAHARTTLRLSNLRGDQGDPRTLTASAAALDLIRKQVAANPASADLRRSLAQGLVSRGQILRQAKRTPEAIPLVREGIDILDRLTRDHPAEVTFRLDLAIAWGELGNFLYTTKKLDEAEKAYRRDLEAVERAAAEYPDVPDYKERVGRAYYSVGLAVSEGPRPADALPLYDRAIALLVGPVAANPDHDLNRNSLLNSHWGRAEILEGLKRPKEAAEAWRAMLTLIPEGGLDHRNYRLKLAAALVAAGDVAAGVAEADAVAAHPKATDAQKAEAAKVRAAVKK